MKALVFRGSVYGTDAIDIAALFIGAKAGRNMDEEVDLLAVIEQMDREQLAALLDLPLPSPELVATTRKLIAERLASQRLRLAE